MNRSRFYLATFFTVLCWNAYGKDKHPRKTDDSPQDQIEVVACLPLTSGPVTGFLETQHYRRSYLYAEHESGQRVSLIDITSSDRPTLLADIASGNLVAVAGNAALVSSLAPSTQITAAPQTFRIMSFADPLHPVVKQQFDHVTAMARDEKRGLVFLANDAGVWILQQRFAQDPDAQKEWEHMMLDNR